MDQMIVRWKEGIDMSAKGYGALSLINRHPHPNAAKVFINWFLSPKGQLPSRDPFIRPTRPIPVEWIFPKTICQLRVDGKKVLSTLTWSNLSG